jgi:CTP:phosphocholine cytidylyltransferase-like protein
MFCIQPVTVIFITHVDDKNSLVHLELRSNFLERKYVCYVAVIKKNTLSRLFLREEWSALYRKIIRNKKCEKLRIVL